ncbi:MAG: hypothetical protein Q9M75_02120, partial [Ghiorsea sp.]|nr:hypothetical protein [Ghiorsea sp.]
GAVVMLLRREPKHPAEQAETKENGFDEVDDAIEESVPTEETLEDEDVSKLVDVDDFEMPSDLPDDSTSLETENNDDDSLEEIPDFTDDETGEMEAFDSDVDETPDPSVNYLEEADVYLRYGMEDEAERQVRMALKLDNQDPAAHAKLIQVLRIRGDADGEGKASNIAKSVLAGAALVTFEGLLSDASVDAVESDAASNAVEESVDGDDQASEISALKDDAFTGEDTGIVDFGEINFDADDSLDTSADVSEEAMPADVMEPELLDTGKMDFGEVEEDPILQADDAIDFAGIDFGETDSNTDVNMDDIGIESINLGDDDVMDDAKALNTGDLDFGALEISDDNEVKDNSVSDDNALADVSLDDAMDIEALDTGELDFGALDIAEDSDAKTEIDLDDVSLEDAMGIEALDTGELDFGDLNMDAADTDTNIDLNKLDDKASVSADVMEDEALDTGAVDFGDFLSDSAEDSATPDVESDADAEIDFDFSEMGANDLTEEKNNTGDFDQSIELENLGIDFDETESSEEALSIIEPEGEDLEGTSAVQITDETMVVASSDSKVDLNHAINDRQVDQAIAQAAEDAKAAVVDIPEGVDDPFAAASDLLSDAEEDNLAADISNDDIDEVQGFDTDALALDEPAKQADDEELLDDLDSISLDLSGFSDDADSALNEVKAIEEELTSEVDIDLDGLDMIGDDLLIDVDEADSIEASTELDLDDFDLEEINMDDDAGEISTASKSASDNFDATVILDNTQNNLQQDAVKDTSEAHLDSIDDALSEETLVMNASSDPMEDEFSATGELKDIERSIESLQNGDTAINKDETTELDGLMSDLKGLLDEDEPKK